MDHKFKCYVRFKPVAGNVAENIWITLGRIDWDMFAEAHNVGGAWQLGTANSVRNPPTIDTNDDTFPFWPEIISND